MVKGLPGLKLLRATYITHTFARHTHEEYAVGVIESGALGFQFLGKNYVAPAGSINLVFPGEVHDGYAATEEGFTYRMYYIDPGHLRRAAGEVMLGQGFLPHFKEGVLNDRYLSHEIHALHQALEQGGFGIMEMETRLARILANWVARHADPRPAWKSTGKEPVAVQRARDYIEDNWERDIRLAELSKTTGLSSYHLTRTFTAAVGMPPHAYLLQTRIRHARRMLEAKRPPAEVAAATGFADQSHLTRRFKRIVGVTPGVYSKIVQDR